MKHNLLLSLGLCIAGTCMGQKTSTGNITFPSVNANACMSIPKAFTYNHKPLLTFRNGRDSYGNASSQINVYDENIDLVKSFNVQDDKKFYYTLTYNVQKRDVKQVKKIDEYKHEEGKYHNLNEWITEQSRYNQNVRQALIIKPQENGDTLVAVDFDKVQNPVGGGQSNRQMYYFYDYFGLQYPLRYWILEAKPYNDYGYRMLYTCDATYAVDYTEWRNEGVKNVDKSTDLSHLYLCNVNLDNGGTLGGNSYFDVSQTLFNNDEDFEYLIPKCALSATYPGTSMGSADAGEIWFGERIITEQTTLASEKRNVVMTGFQVVSSSGNIVKDLDFGNGFEAALGSDDYCAAVITMGGKRYLAFNGWSAGTQSTIFYQIDNASTAIQPLKITPASMTVRTSSGHSCSTLRISLGDANAEGSHIVVTSASGQTIARSEIPAGESQTQMTVDAPAGVYCISRVQNGHVCETRKVEL